MKENELRIGDYFDYHGQTVRVLNIFRDGKVDWGYFQDSIGFLRMLNEDDCPRPIPLTEQWLLDFGFERGIDDIFRDSKNCLEVFFHDKGLEVMIDSVCTKNKYVHQLQNLYFALTGEELTLKEDMDI